jgi:hypothetical protein
VKVQGSDSVGLLAASVAVLVSLLLSGVTTRKKVDTCRRSTPGDFAEVVLKQGIRHGCLANANMAEHSNFNLKALR